MVTDPHGELYDGPLHPVRRRRMKAIIVYDSVHGNTEMVARAIGDALAGAVSVRHIDEVTAAEAEAVDMLIVGSPTHGGWFTEAIKAWLDQLPATALQGAHVAVFDTRTPPNLVSRIFGFTAPRIAKGLEKKGATLVGEPGGFIVEGIKGPLKQGELERAAGWAQELAASMG
jgi:flavodoxin I